MMRRVKISHHLIVQMLTTGYTVERLEVVEGLPPGARLAVVDMYDEDTVSLMFDVAEDGTSSDEADLEIFIRHPPLPYARPAPVPRGLL